MNAFEFVATAHARRGARGRRRAGRGVPRRRHQSRRSDEGGRQPAGADCPYRPARRARRMETLPDGRRPANRRAGRATPIVAGGRRIRRPLPADRRGDCFPGRRAQLRNAATIGGNLMQRTRCAYFFDPASACNKRAPGAGCDARGGETRGAAVLGASEALRRHRTLPTSAWRWSRSTRWSRSPAPRAGAKSPLDAFYLPAAAIRRSARTELRPGELIVAVRLPAEAAAFAGHRVI